MGVLDKQSLGSKGTREAKKMKCKYCDEIVENVDQKATAVTCYKCVIQMCNKPNIK
jgi:hypothetical protein